MTTTTAQGFQSEQIEQAVSELAGQEVFAYFDDGTDYFEGKLEVADGFIFVGGHEVPNESVLEAGIVDGWPDLLIVTPEAS